MSTHGVGPVTVTSTSAGYDVAIGDWPDTARFGCNFLYVDIDVGEGGTVTGTYRVHHSPFADSYLDIYLLEPGITWDPGTTWNETERCFRTDYPPGVVAIAGPIDAWAYQPDWITPDFQLNVALDGYEHESVRVVFRQWSWGEVFNEAVESRVFLNAPTGRLTLFLDVDGFDPADPTGTSDNGWYVPCSHMNGTSVLPTELPQRIHVVAAYVDTAGGVVPPPPNGDATLSVTQVSRIRGIAMNASHPTRSDTDPDFSPANTIAVFGSDQTARFELECWDYGGFATVSVTHGSETSDAMRLPQDANGNSIPDSGWLAGTALIADTQLDPGADEDNTPGVQGPPSAGLTGDGLVNFEEYRGFVVRGEHRRTNPFHKDLFVSSNLAAGIAFAFPNLPTATHRINGEDESGTDEYRTADRVINANYENSGDGGNIPGRSASNFQKALRVVGIATSPLGLFGETFTQTNLPATPNESLRIEVYTKSHDDLKKPPHRYSATQIQNELRRTIGHEIGHGIHLCHREIGATCADGAAVGTSDSIMSSALFGGPPQSDPRSQYNAADQAQIRLHVRF